LVNNLYDKEVEFNIVELKRMHLNVDIYTQAVASKLKNRNNKLYRVLK
jgi:ribosomal protein S3